MGRWFLCLLYWKTNHEVKLSRSPPNTGNGRPYVTVRNVIKTKCHAVAVAAAVAAGGGVYDAGISATLTSADD
jgi:hypothetical protein